MTGIEQVTKPANRLAVDGDHRCKKCNSLFDKRIKRGFFTKKVLFFLPIKLYYCSKCHKTRMVLVN